jgi:energy-coupling factor transporter transmembrane protein EcfT
MTHAWHDAYRHPSTPAHHLDPRSKFFLMLLLIGVVLFSRHISREQAAGYLAILLGCTVLGRISWRAMGVRFLTLLPFFALMGISAVFSSLPHLPLCGCSG